MVAAKGNRLWTTDGLADEAVTDGDEHEKNGGDGEQFSGVEFLECDEVFHGGRSLFLMWRLRFRERRGRYIRLTAFLRAAASDATSSRDSK